MKYIRKYSYLILVFLFLLIIVLIMSSKNKRSVSSVTITESSAGAMAENKSNLQGGDNPAEETMFTSSEVQEETDNTTITENSEKAIDTNRSYLPGSDNSTGETMFTSSEIPAQMDSIAIAENSTKAIDENRSYSPESEYPEEKMVFTNPRTSEEETVSANPKTPEEEMISASLETPEEEMTSASPGVPEEETISVSQEAEKSHAIEGIPGYEYADRFPADMVFASQESIELLADIYENIGFEGEFQFGDKTVYDFYRQKYSLILDRKVKIYDRKGNESLLYNRYNPMGRLQYQLNIQEATDKLYFFDIDGDGLPELCVQGTSGTYICKYDADSDQYTEWWGRPTPAIRFWEPEK